MIQQTLSESEWEELETEDQIDQICDWFEQALRLGQSPSPLAFVAKLPLEYRAEALDQLAQLQQAYNRRNDGSDADTERNSAATYSVHAFQAKSETDFELAHRSFSEASPSSNAESRVQFPIPFGSYILTRLLGSGAFGDVFLGRRVGTETDFAVKVPRPKLMVDEQDRILLIREAKNAGRLDHSGIVRIHDQGVCGSTPFIAYEYVPGMTLKDYVKQAGPLADEVVVELMADLADAVHHAHEQGVVHRDLKPANVLLKFTNGPPDDFDCPEKLVAKLSDFGISKRLNSDTLATVPGEILGTPAYMSPEQASGNSCDVTRLSDIYSLGAVMHELLIGETPFTGEPAAIVKQIEKSEIPPIQKRKSSVDLNLATICQKALRLEPAHRYQSAKEFAADLRRHQRFEPILARPVGLSERTYLWAKRHPTESICACLLAMVISVFTIHSLMAPPSEHPLLSQDGLLRQAVQSEQPIEEWLHRLPVSLSKPDSLMDRLDRPFDAKQLRLIADKLRPHAVSVTPLLIDAFRRNEGNFVRQTPIGCLIGLVAPSEFEKLNISDAVVEWLMRSEVARDQKGCGRVVQQLKPQILASLVRFYSGSRTDADRNSSREHLYSLLDEPDVELAVRGLSSARPEELDAWRAELSDYHREAAKSIREHLVRMGNAFQDDEAGEDQARICGNLLMMEFGLGKTDLLWPALSAPVDPRPRTYFAHQIGLTGFDLSPLFERLKIESDSRVAYGILLALSQADPANIDPETDRSLRSWVQTSYRTHPAAGVHGMCRYLLRQWGQADEVRLADQALIPDGRRSDREWYVNSIGMTMRVFKAPTVMTISMSPRQSDGSRVGSLKWSRHELGHSFAISTDVIDFEAFKRLNNTFNASTTIDGSNDTDSPNARSISFQDAIAFAGKLNITPETAKTILSGVDADEREYSEINLELNGYRLPTREEWHSAFRSGLSFATTNGTLYTPFHQAYTAETQGRNVLPNSTGMFSPSPNEREWTISQIDSRLMNEYVFTNDLLRSIRSRTAVYTCRPPSSLNSRAPFFDVPIMPTARTETSFLVFRLAASVGT